jgi:DNA-binding CsgD family transcriptional regulator
MATRGHLKSVEFKQAALAATSAGAILEISTPPDAAGTTTAIMKSAGAAEPVTAATVKSPAAPASPVAAMAAKGVPAPRFTAEETILLRGLGSGASSKEMAAQMRLPRETLYRLIGDLRRKTGASSDTALAVWVLRNMSTGAGERRGGGR